MRFLKVVIRIVKCMGLWLSGLGNMVFFGFWNSVGLSLKVFRRVIGKLRVVIYLRFVFFLKK